MTYIVSAFSSYGILHRRQTEGDVQVHHGGGNMPEKGGKGRSGGYSTLRRFLGRKLEGGETAL